MQNENWRSFGRRLREFERFISDYGEFSSDDLEFTPVVMIGERSGGNVSANTGVQAVDNLWPERQRMRPDEIAQTIERVIREVGHPLTRGQLVSALERRDIDLPAADKARYLGTIIWRHKKIFVNIEGRGYWLRNVHLVGTAPRNLSGRPSYELAEDQTF